MAPAESGVPRTVRCAVYTRKSTEEGLSQEFNSLDAQRECAEAYILSQRQEGWTVLPRHYDDGGCSGANLDRPALQRLLADIQAGQIDCVVIYKVDPGQQWRTLWDHPRRRDIRRRYRLPNHAEWHTNDSLQLLLAMHELLGRTGFRTD